MTYHAATVPVVEGEAHGIKVCLRNYPVREADDGSGKRIELYPDFNVALIDAIWQEISECKGLIIDGQGLPVQSCLRIRDCPPIPFEIRITERKSNRQFTAEMPDALIDGLRRAGISR